MFVNQAIFSRSNDCSKSDDDAGRSSIGSNANCFASPPNGQIILFHLDAAPEYAGSRNDEGSEFNAVALVEVIGYKWLKYAGDGSSGRTYGGSLIATVSPESSGKRVGWGAMVHLTEKFSVGIARRDLGRDGDETTWLVSADLGKLLDMTSLQERLDFRKLARTNP
ncbi:hypothetical protein CSC75_05665 [Pseudoxanthomonas wuyuanensis]|nr:hypothetical protein CSC75_05665 [Pseudoxanthomonas wuyuanensis]